MKVAYARWAEGIIAVTIVVLFIASIAPNNRPSATACEIWSLVAWAAPVSIFIGGSVLRYRVVRNIGWLWLAEGIVALTLAHFYFWIIEPNYSPFATACERWSPVTRVVAPVLMVIGGSILRYRVVRIIGWLWLMVLFGELIYFA